MERRDYILDEIRKFGQMVLGLMGKLQRLKENALYHTAYSMADQEFESEAGFSLRMLSEMDRENLEAFLKNHPELSVENLELLADLMIEISDDPGCNQRNFLAVAKILIEIAIERDKTWSAERMGKLAFIEKKGIGI
jgi:hypothetical protein